MIHATTVHRTALVTFATAIATIAGAWAFEILGGYNPCPLCLQQRWAYYFAVPVLGLIWLRMISNKADLDVVRWGFIFVAVAMIVNAGLGIYHSGVEWGWFEGPTACSTGAGLSGGLPDLSKAKVISCSEAQWRFAGLSFAGWNAVISSLIAVLSLFGARRTYGSSSVSQ